MCLKTIILGQLFLESKIIHNNLQETLITINFLIRILKIFKKKKMYFLKSNQKSVSKFCRKHII